VIANYTDVLASEAFWTAMRNSVISAVGTTLGAAVLGVMASYVLARYDFTGKAVMYSVFAAGLMFPVTVAITPLYLLIRNLGLVNNLAGIILPQIAFALPTTIIILVPFLKAIPKELEEAASIDGTSRLGFFWRMVIPLSLPGVITVGILAFIGAWNGYMLPLFILNDQSLLTLPLGVQNFASQYSVDTARVLAYTSLSMLPALIFFSMFERRIVGGLTGAVKG
jgi:raffinose/stachyose/melibiose transport system permease protein